MQKKLYIKGQSAYCTVWAYAQKNVNHLREAECSLSSAATNIPKPSENGIAPVSLYSPLFQRGFF